MSVRGIQPASQINESYDKLHTLSLITLLKTLRHVVKTLNKRNAVIEETEKQKPFPIVDEMQ